MSVISLEVAALFEIEDEASAPLAAIASAVEKIAGLADKAVAGLTELSNVSLSALQRGLDNLGESIGTLNRATTTVTEAATQTAAAVSASAGEAAARVDEITAAYGRAAEAQENFRRQAAMPLAIGERSYDGEIGGPDLVPFRGGGAASGYRRPTGPIIDHDPLPLGLEGNGGYLALGYGGAAEAARQASGGALAAMPFGYGRNGHAGTESPYFGGGANPYIGPESGPAINMGNRPHDESLDIPNAPQGAENEWRGGLYGRGVVPPGGGGGSSGGGGGRRGSDGVIHFGLAEMAADWSVGEAFTSAAEEENAIARTMIGLQIEPNSAEGRRAAVQLRDVARRATAGTLYTERDTAKAGAVYARELGFNAAEGGLTKYAQSFPVALRSAEISQQEGLGDLDSSLTANLEYAHMTGHYEPKALERSLNVLQQVATLTSTPVAGEESILKYSVPIARAAGVDPDRAAALTGFLQQSGFNSSTAGTGLSALMLGVLQTGGGINAHLEHGRANAERELSHALGLSPDEVKKAHKEAHGSKHVDALRAMGITDAAGHLTVLNGNGGLDTDRLLADIAGYSHGRKPAQVMETLHDAFGTRGERIAGVLTTPDALAREKRFEENVFSGADRFGAAHVQQLLADTTEQKFQQALARLADSANAAATPLLGIANAALGGAVAGLNGAVHEMHDHPIVAGVAGAAATVGALYGTFRVGSGAIRVARNMLGRFAGGSGGAAVEAAEAAEAPVAAAAGGGMLELLGAGLGAFSKRLLPVAGGYIAHQADLDSNGKSRAGSWIDAHVPGAAGLDDWFYRHTGGAVGVPLQPGGSAASPAVSTVAGARAAGGPAGGAGAVTVNLGGITLNGVGTDIRPIVERLFHELAEKLGQSLSHASSFTAGSGLSVFPNGALP